MAGTHQRRVENNGRSPGASACASDILHVNAVVVSPGRGVNVAAAHVEPAAGVGSNASRRARSIPPIDRGRVVAQGTVGIRIAEASHHGRE